MTVGCRKCSWADAHEQWVIASDGAGERACPKPTRQRLLSVFLLIFFVSALNYLCYQPLCWITYVINYFIKILSH